METKFLIFLLTLFFNQSYSQESDKVKVDLKLQTKYKDTLQSIGERLTGKWKYLGTRQNETLSDTLGGGTRHGKWIYDVVENGIAYEIVNGKRQKVDYYYEISFDFEKRKGSYSRKKTYSNEIFNTHTTCQSVPEIIYYDEKFGILFIGMGGESFETISELNEEKLILENGKEYLKIE